MMLYSWHNKDASCIETEQTDNKTDKTNYGKQNYRNEQARCRESDCDSDSGGSGDCPCCSRG
jgi:hypothetical protein